MQETFTGRVLTIKISDSAAGPEFGVEGQPGTFCMFSINRNDNHELETVFLWSSVRDQALNAAGFPLPTSKDWLIRSMQLSLLRDAMEQQRTVTVTLSDPANAHVRTLVIGTI